MARILVAGGLFSDDQDPDMGAARTAFAAALGREIVQRGDVLLRWMPHGSGRNSSASCSSGRC